MLLGLTIVELLQFGLVLALGLLPLAIVLVADPSRPLNAGRLARRIRRPGWARTGVVAMVAHWLADLLS